MRATPVHAKAVTRVCTTPSRSPVAMAGSYSPSVKNCPTRALASGSSGLRQSFSAQTSPTACGPLRPIPGDPVVSDPSE